MHFDKNVFWSQSKLSATAHIFTWFFYVNYPSSLMCGHTFSFPWNKGLLDIALTREWPEFAVSLIKNEHNGCWTRHSWPQFLLAYLPALISVGQNGHRFGPGQLTHRLGWELCCWTKCVPQESRQNLVAVLDGDWCTHLQPWWYVLHHLVHRQHTWR